METPSAPSFVERYKTSKEPRWFSREDCLVLHEMMLLRYGGTPGVRDLALLDTAVSRPRERFASGVNGLADLAACYAAGIAVDHPFMSGNIALSFVIAIAFMRCHGFQFTDNEVAV